MSGWFDQLLHSEYGAGIPGPETILLVILLAFCIGHVVGWIYMWTHAGLSYSQMFVASLVVLPPMVALVMQLMVGDVVMALGLMAVFAMVRFRNVLKDTRDASFVLWAIVEGMAVGTMRFSTALIGLLCVGTLFVYLRVTSFGGRHRFDVIVSMQTFGDGPVQALKQILRRHSVRIQLTSQRELADQSRDFSYRLLLRNPQRSGELLSELESTEGIGHVSLFHREDESEI
jgi:hypothetical protein